jgi:hypothetical protein
MSTGSKILLGFFTFLPLVFGIAWLVDYILLIVDLVTNIPVDGDAQLYQQTYMLHFFSGTFLYLMLLSILTHIGLMIYYILHVVRYGAKSEGEKVMWILMFIFIGTLSFVVYYFMRALPGINYNRPRVNE